MKHIAKLLLICFLVSCSKKKLDTVVLSPNKDNKIAFTLNDKGQLFYSVAHKELQFIKASALGFELKNKSLKDGFEILDSEIKSSNTSWETVWGQRKTVKDHYNQLTLHLKQKTTGILIDLLAKSFDDGVAFRYVFPEQESLKEFIITNELTEFNFKEDYKAWWNFADYDNYEKVYYNSPINIVGDSLKFERRPDKEERANMINTPATIEVNDKLVVSVHEADLTDYAGMNLLNTLEGTKLKAHLTPWLNGDLVRAKTPFKSPWRLIQIGENAGELVNSDIILNLNPACAYEDTSFIETYKYIGIWWELHTGKTAWAEKTQFGRPITKPHGANTENAKYHIDFAAEHGFPDVLIEGWDKGWDNMEGSWTGYGIFDWKTSTDDFDIQEVADYGK